MEHDRHCYTRTPPLTKEELAESLARSDRRLRATLLYDIHAKQDYLAKIEKRITERGEGLEPVYLANDNVHHRLG
jgi:hypothetical protein